MNQAGSHLNIRPFSGMGISPLPIYFDRTKNRRDLLNLAKKLLQNSFCRHLSNVFGVELCIFFRFQIE